MINNEPIYGQCPFCGGALTTLHQCQERNEFMEGMIDVADWREWLDKQFEDKLASIQAEIVRLKRCYESATGKPVCGEGSVIRMECQQMTTMRTQLDQQYKLLQRSVEVIRYGIHEGATPKDFWDNYPITIAQALLSDLEAALK